MREEPAPIVLLHHRKDPEMAAEPKQPGPVRRVRELPEGEAGPRADVERRLRPVDVVEPCGRQERAGHGLRAVAPPDSAAPEGREPLEVVMRATLEIERHADAK